MESRVFPAPSGLHQVNPRGSPKCLTESKGAQAKEYEVKCFVKEHENNQDDELIESAYLVAGLCREQGE